MQLVQTKLDDSKKKRSNIFN